MKKTAPVGGAGGVSGNETGHAQIGAFFKIWGDVYSLAGRQPLLADEMLSRMPISTFVMAYIYNGNFDAAEYNANELSMRKINGHDMKPLYTIGLPRA